MQVWKVKDILEDDYGCEERPEDEPVCLVILAENDHGQTRYIRMTEDEIVKKGIDKGSIIY